MSIFSKDPVKKQVSQIIKPLPKQKRKAIDEHLFKLSREVDFWEDIFPKEGMSPNEIELILKAYQAALKPENKERFNLALFIFSAISEIRQESISPHRDFYISVLLGLMSSDRSLDTHLICMAALLRVGEVQIEPHAKELVQSVNLIAVYNMKSLRTLTKLLDVLDQETQYAWAMEIIQDYPHQWGRSSRIINALNALDYAFPVLLKNLDKAAFNAIQTFLNSLVTQMQSLGPVSHAQILPMTKPIEKTLNILMESENLKSSNLIVDFMVDVAPKPLRREGKRVYNTSLIPHARRLATVDWKNKSHAMILLEDRLGKDKFAIYMDFLTS